MKEINLFDPRLYHSGKAEVTTKKIETSILFFDGVEFSKDMENEAMIEIVDKMHSCMWKVLDDEFNYYWAETKTYHAENDLILVPTGDGYAIAINDVFDDKDILTIGVALYKKFTKKGIRFRMGIAKGKSILRIDLNGNLNIFGVGIVRAARVCSFAKEGQILIHNSLADSLLTDGKVPELQEIKNEFTAKHQAKYKCYNYYKKDDFGIINKK